jgi:hypothetical protein
MKNTFNSAFFAAICVPLVMGSSIAWAQAAAAAAGQATAVRSVRAVCCKCIDGSKQTASIATGSAPWRVTTTPSGAGLGSVVASGNPGWTMVPGGGWVGPSGAPTQAGSYTYELLIEVPRCVISPRALSIEGRFAADNSATVYFDGNQVAVSQGSPNLGFQAAGVTPFTISGVTAGFHTLKVVVNNQGNVTGLNVAGQVTTACPDQPEVAPN